MFGNPYGTPWNLPLKLYFDTFIKKFGYHKHYLALAGLGAYVAKYPEKFAGVDSFAVAWRTELETQLKKLVSGTFGTIHKDVELEAVKLTGDAQAFVDWHLEFVQACSLLYTGSATALIEGKFGSLAKSESTEVREKSKREQLDAMYANAFWTYQFNRIWVNLNFTPEQINSVYPTLQLIKPELILPTTPAGQEHINPDTTEPTPPDDIGQESVEMSELQEDAPASAIPEEHDNFPREIETPDPYLDVVDAAQHYLENEIDATPYVRIEAEGKNPAKVFAVKRLRHYETLQDLDRQTALLEELKTAILPTLALATEKEAWETYYDDAVIILSKYGIRMDTPTRDDLRISFRQARQNAYSGGLLAFGREHGAVGVRIKNLLDGHTIRIEHKAWHNVVVDMNDTDTLDRVLPPSDFGCVCYAELVYNPALITPPSEYPDIWPGETYRYYTAG
ncbi:hypothetical protein GF380_00970 [Candidatus Uhrbacteria bacterium]|nr:hypothetical protein [Candidatus Uhrbacteria bacterium]